jgi:hypothetical protein
MIHQNTLEMHKTLEPACQRNFLGRMGRVLAQLWNLWLAGAEKYNTMSTNSGGPYGILWPRFTTYYSWRSNYHQIMGSLDSDHPE